MTSKIQWTNETLNLTTGCTRVTHRDADGRLLPGGCDQCYAFAFHDRHHVAYRRGNHPDALPQYHRPFSATARNPLTGERPQGVQFHPDRLEQIARWKKPRRIFVDSMSDFWHESIPDSYIAKCLAFFAAHPRHTFQLLTKRPERQRDFMRRHYPQGIPNVWNGVSIASQYWAEVWMPFIVETPSPVRWLSMEPLVGPVDLRQWLKLSWVCEYCHRRAHCTELPGDWSLIWQAAVCPDCWPRMIAAGGIHNVPGGAYADGAPDPRPWRPQIEWVVVGGESGQKARPMDGDPSAVEAWARSIVEQCQTAGVPVFVKQMGTKWARAHGLRSLHAGDPAQWPRDVRIREFPA